MIPVPGAAYVGTHGLQTLPRRLVVHRPQAEPYIAAVQGLAAAGPASTARGRHRAREQAHGACRALPPCRGRAATRHAILTPVVDRRERAASPSRRGISFEVKPPLPFTKGTATRACWGRRVRHGAFCGDDLTDVTGFAAIHRWGGRDARRRALRPGRGHCTRHPKWSPRPTSGWRHARRRRLRAVAAPGPLTVGAGAPTGLRAGARLSSPELGRALAEEGVHPFALVIVAKQGRTGRARSPPGRQVHVDAACTARFAVRIVRGLLPASSGRASWPGP